MKKHITEFIINFSLVILAIVILLLPIFDIYDLKMILLLIFGLYTLLKLTSFIIFRKDFESLFIAIFSLIALIVTFLEELKTEKLILLLLIWMGLNALVKLKKIDYYHDKKNKLWLLKLFMLFVFIISGLLMGINLFDENIQLVSIGFFFLISGILDTIEALVNLLEGDYNASNR